MVSDVVFHNALNALFQRRPRPPGSGRRRADQSNEGENEIYKNHGSTQQLVMLSYRITSATSLNDQIPSSALACFQALSPRATRIALTELDRHIRTVIPPSPEQRHAHRLLRGIVTVYVHANQHVCIAVSEVKNSANGDGNSNGDGDDTSSIVSLRDVYYDRAMSTTSIVGLALQGDYTHDQRDVYNEAFCNCRGFAFRPTQESYCHHVLIAAIATAYDLAPVQHVEQERFIYLLKKAST